MTTNHYTKLRGHTFSCLFGNPFILISSFVHLQQKTLRDFPGFIFRLFPRSFSNAFLLQGKHFWNTKNHRSFRITMTTFYIAFLFFVLLTSVSTAVGSSISTVSACTIFIETILYRNSVIALLRFRQVSTNGRSGVLAGYTRSTNKPVEQLMIVDSKAA